MAFVSSKSSLEQLMMSRKIFVKLAIVPLSCFMTNMIFKGTDLRYKI